MSIADFLQNVERRAFKHALYTMQDEDAALDAVQDAMLKLVENYAERPEAEWPLLFQRILHNTMLDFFRRQKVRRFWLRPWHTDVGPEEDELEPDFVAEDGDWFSFNPADQLQREQTLAAIEAALARLPLRQREAFLLRYWEDMDVAETAAVMGCSEGSVKTHCSRAVHALAALLGDSLPLVEKKS